MKMPIIDCKIGDIVQYIYQGSNPQPSRFVLAMIIGEKLLRGQHKWLIRPLGVEDTRPYLISTTSIVWKKVA